MPTIRIDVALYWVTIAVLAVGLYWSYQSHLNDQYEIVELRKKVEQLRPVTIDSEGNVIVKGKQLKIK